MEPKEEPLDFAWMRLLLLVDFFIILTEFAASIFVYKSAMLTIVCGIQGGFLVLTLNRVNDRERLDPHDIDVFVLDVLIAFAVVVWCVFLRQDLFGWLAVMHTLFAAARLYKYRSYLKKQEGTSWDDGRHDD